LYIIWYHNAYAFALKDTKNRAQNRILFVFAGTEYLRRIKDTKKSRVRKQINSILRSEDLPDAPEDVENPATRGRFRKDCGTLQKEAKAAPPADRDHPLRRSGRKS